MSRRGFWVAIVGLTVGCLILGCGASQQPSPPAVQSSTPTDAAPAQTIQHIAASTLTIGDYLPPLDDGRIELAVPGDWSTLPRDSEHLVRFYHTARNGPPRLQVTAEDRVVGAINTVTADNVEQFAALVAAELAEKEKSNSLVDPVVPMIVGDTPCARYVSRVAIAMGDATVTVERQRLLVLRDGRMYTIDLLVRSLDDTNRRAAYAACASLRFRESSE